MFAELAASFPERAKGMAFAMESLAQMMSNSVTTENYSWSELPSNAVIVDVGGGKGFACRALAELHPRYRFIVQDLEGTVAAGKAQCPSGLLESGQIEFQVHDFFTPQTVEGADVYFFRAIFHDWPDKYCIKILQALTPAMKKGGRVVIQDPHTPDPKQLGWWQDRQARASNLRMKLLFNSHDREKGEWVELFKKADRRWQVNVEGVKVHERDPGNQVGQLMAVVEAVWEG
jgi:SAM-dependent methyltransferase